MEEKIKRKRGVVSQTSIHLKLDNDLYELLKNIKNRNRFINVSIREKIIREK